LLLTANATEGNRELPWATGDILCVIYMVYDSVLAYRHQRWEESRHRVTYCELAAMWRVCRSEEPDGNFLRMLSMTAG
jgi:hypothetical protein